MISNTFVCICMTLSIYTWHMYDSVKLRKQFVQKTNSDSFCLPSSFFKLGTLLVASSIHVPSAEYFSSKGFPTNTRSTNDGSSASFANSADVAH